LHDRDELWSLLVVITERKAFDLALHARRQKRDWRRESPGPGPGDDGSSPGHDLAGREPMPEFAALVAEECGRLLGLLEDEQLRSIALWKMEGYTNVEIGGRLGCALATVERRLKLIRKLWEKEMPE
jgi:DNA-directed RNA polymerase specialized sigma24 family protein